MNVSLMSPDLNPCRCVYVGVGDSLSAPHVAPAGVAVFRRDGVTPDRED
jgi:hypothetical protein